MATADAQGRRRARASNATAAASSFTAAATAGASTTAAARTRPPTSRTWRWSGSTLTCPEARVGVRHPQRRLHRQGRQPAQAVGQQGRRRPPAGALVMPPQSGRSLSPARSHDTAFRPQTRRPHDEIVRHPDAQTAPDRRCLPPAPRWPPTATSPHGYGMKAAGMGGATVAHGPGQPGRRRPTRPAWSGSAAASTSVPTSSCPSATPNAAAALFAADQRQGRQRQARRSWCRSSATTA